MIGVVGDAVVVVGRVNVFDVVMVVSVVEVVVGGRQHSDSEQLSTHPD